MSDIRVNMVNRVKSSAIRIEQHNGRAHLVIPSYTLPDGVVMNGGMYPKDEIDRAWPTMQNTLAPIGHPVNANGEWLSAVHPDALHNFHGGAWNKVVRRDGHRVYAEKWVDIGYAQNTESGKRLLEAVRYNAETGVCEGPASPIHTSTGLLLQQEPAPAGAPFDWTARNMRLDHDAILLDEPGAATPSQGVGLMVNCSDAVHVQNLDDDTYQAREAALGQALAARFGAGTWVRDFDQAAVVFRSPDSTFRQIDYRVLEAGGVELNGDPVEVRQKTSWVPRVIANLWRIVSPSNAPITTNQPGEEQSMPLSEEDLKAIGSLIGNQLEPLTTKLNEHGEAITSLKTNSDALAQQVKNAAEQKAAADKALVAEKHGELVANSVAPDKLAELADAIRDGQGADKLPAGSSASNADNAEWGQVPTVGGK